MGNEAVGDDQFVHNTISNGGASRHAGTNAPAPTSGFMVGGATDPAGNKYREQTLKANDLHAYTVAQHAQAIQDHFGDAVNKDSIYQGSWREGSKKVVLDASNHLPDRLAAVRLGRDRGERGVYDIAANKTIPTAGAHRAGNHKGRELSESGTPIGYQGKHEAGEHKAGAHKDSYSFSNEITSPGGGGAHKYEGKHTAGAHKG